MEDLKTNIKKALLITLTCLVIGSAEALSWYCIKILIKGGINYDLLSVTLLLIFNVILLMISLGQKMEV